MKKVVGDGKAQKTEKIHITFKTHFIYIDEVVGIREAGYGRLVDWNNQLKGLATLSGSEQGFLTVNTSLRFLLPPFLRRRVQARPRMIQVVDTSS